MYGINARFLLHECTSIFFSVRAHTGGGTLAEQLQSSAHAGNIIDTKRCVPTLEACTVIVGGGERVRGCTVLESTISAQGALPAMHNLNHLYR